MSYLKELKTNLQQQHGYHTNWKLVKETEIKENKREEFINVDFFDTVTRQTTKPTCQNMDLIVPSKMRTRNQQMQLEQLLNIIGQELDPLTTKHRVDHDDTIQQDTYKQCKFERNDEKRQYRIQEFIKTEKSYVETLKTLVTYVVAPLKQTVVLNTFKCNKIFLNIDQIMAVNEAFLLDLEQKPLPFGNMCEKHIKNFECYRKYLLEQSEAQKLQAKEYKSNQSYRRFLIKLDQSEFKRKRLQDILVEPVQRISRYSMMLREILQLTPLEHVDYRGLKIACDKAKEIATMADDDPTKTATMFLNLYQQIKDSPCSLINQNRSLVAHLDATEVHRVTNKPTRSVSLFLLTDKILVASRSDGKATKLHELLNPTPNKKSHLKFKGWAYIESISLFHGPPEDQNSFILSATQVPLEQDTLFTSFEKYFYKGPRLFSVSNLEKLKEFKSLYQKTRALVKQYETTDKTYHKAWKDVPSYCNVYSPENYAKAKYKSDCCLVYVDDDLSAQSIDFTQPWIIGLIQPEEMKGFRFNVCTKISLPTPVKTNTPTIDFESIFWNNLWYLEQQLTKSTEYRAYSMLKIQQAIHGRDSMRRPSRSMSRTPSIPSFGKLFNSNNNNGTTVASGSVSPSKMIKSPQSKSPVHVPIVAYNMPSASASTLSTTGSDYTTESTRLSPSLIKTISSVNSSDQSSACSMMTEEEDEEDLPPPEEDYLTLKTVTKTEATYKSNNGLEDEMQQQWKTLISKYKLSPPHIVALK